MEATMAQRVSVELEDDLDGGPADETLRFGLGGAEYEIDLSKKNASRFRRQIAPYIEHARKAGRGQRRRLVRSSSSRDRSGDIRAWAKATASLSASAGASRRALSSSTKPPRQARDAGPNHGGPEPIVAPLVPAGDSSSRRCRWEPSVARSMPR
jgi:hypothetical protein